MKFTAIPLNEAGNEAYICEFEGAANVENDLVAALGSQLDVILEQGVKWAVVDFSNVLFISSAGVGTLLSRRRKFRRRRRAAGSTRFLWGVRIPPSG